MKGPADAVDLVEMLSPALGQERAAEVVATTARKLRLPAPPLPRDKALLLLDHLTTEPGLLGVTARFTKARLLLRR